MSKNISLFSGYSQRENRVTNYCLLVMKMLYEENPKYLSELLATLCGENIGKYVGISFRQQERRQKSVPDGLIFQAAFSVYIETKNHDWFYDDQLERHLEALDSEAPGEKVLLALGNFDGERHSRFDTIRHACESKYEGRLMFQAVTFEDLAAALDIKGLPKNLLDVITEFREFLNEENLLRTWRSWLDVVNCAGLPEDVTDGGVYMCPAQGGAYTHGRSRYFGMYRNKRVELVAEIEAVVDVDLNGRTESIKWTNIEADSEELKARARQKVATIRPEAGPTRIFLLGKLYETDFKKDSPGGLRGSKQYFDIAGLKAADAAQLADRLRGHSWSEFDQRDDAI